MSGGCIFPGRSKQKLEICRFDKIRIKQCRSWVRHCIGPVHFEGQNFQDEEDVSGDEGVVAGAAGFGEKAPGASFVTAAFADLRTDFRIVLLFLVLVKLVAVLDRDAVPCS
jgi:hypothetical protein